MDLIKELEKFLLSEIIMDVDQDVKSLAPDDNLVAQGIIDSLGILKLVMFMEERFGIKLTDSDIIPKNFQTLDCLKKLIESRQQG